MFERLTERARKAVVEAQNEAVQLRHNYIGTEHLLLGLIAEDEGIAATVLKAHGLTQKLVRTRVEIIRGKGKEDPGAKVAPFTPRLKKVLELALREALTLGHNYIGTEHILLGLLREREGAAARVLHDCFGASYADCLKRSVLSVIKAKAEEKKEEPNIPEADILAHKVALYALEQRRNPWASPRNMSPAYRAAWDRLYKPPTNRDAVLDEYEKVIREGES